MSLSDEEREKVDALKRHQTVLEENREKYRILELARKEFDGYEVEILTEDRTAVDLKKIELQTEEDSKTREEELLQIALNELEE